MRITKLDGLRGIFCVMIILFHYQQITLSFGKIIPDFVVNNFFVRESYLFVDFFFVLSGFVISYNYSSLPTIPDVTHFLKKRIIRLYPLMVFTVFMVLCFEAMGMLYFPHLCLHVDPFWHNIILTFDTLLFTNSSNILLDTMGVNHPTWSISAEMFSYVVFGILSLAPVGKRKDVLFGSIILGSLVFAIYQQDFFVFNDYGFVRGFVSFFIGYFVWKLSKKEIKMNTLFELLIPCILILLFYILYNMTGVTKQMLGMVTIPTFFGLSLLILLKTNGIVTRFLMTKPIQYLGKISFSVYLNHYLIIRVIPLIAFRTLQIPQTTTNELLVFAVTVLVTILYSELTYRYVEVWGGDFLRRKLNLTKNMNSGTTNKIVTKINP